MENIFATKNTKDIKTEYMKYNPNSKIRIGANYQAIIPENTYKNSNNNVNKNYISNSNNNIKFIK